MKLKNKCINLKNVLRILNHTLKNLKPKSLKLLHLLDQCNNNSKEETAQNLAVTGPYTVDSYTKAEGY